MASFDPDAAQREVVPRVDGKLQITKPMAPPKVAKLSDAPWSCECGEQLLGKKFDVLTHGEHYALYVEGVCVKCEEFVRVLYLSDTVATSQQEQEQRQEEQDQAEVERVLAQVRSIREKAVA